MAERRAKTAKTVRAAKSAKPVRAAKPARAAKPVTLKTAPNDGSVEAFLATVTDPARRADCDAVAAIMARVTGESPMMWGTSIVGFGAYRYVYESGRSGTWMVTGFSPRKQALTIYVMPGLERFPDLLERLGPYRAGKSCLYLRRLADVDLGVLEELVAASVEAMAPKRLRE